MKILFFGDIVGQPGRKALRKILPELQKQYAPDVILVNGENLSHGNGITEKTALELFELGVTAITGGNHTFDKPEAKTLLPKYPNRILRPANYPPNSPGQGHGILETPAGKLLVINLLGRVFMKEEVSSPFSAALRILEEHPGFPTIVDFHAEATSEKQALSWILDGKVSAVVGTHTHVPTADARIFPKGTGYISDLGMVGAKNGILGANRSAVLHRFLTDEKIPFDPEESGPLCSFAVYIEISDQTKHATRIERVDRETILP